MLKLEELNEEAEPKRRSNSLANASKKTLLMISSLLLLFWEVIRVGLASWSDMIDNVDRV